jgi:hypothetical protein
MSAAPKVSLSCQWKWIGCAAEGVHTGPPASPPELPLLLPLPLPEEEPPELLPAPDELPLEDPLELPDEELPWPEPLDELPEELAVPEELPPEPLPELEWPPSPPPVESSPEGCEPEPPGDEEHAAHVEAAATTASSERDRASERAMGMGTRHSATRVPSSGSRPAPRRDAGMPRDAGVTTTSLSPFGCAQSPSGDRPLPLSLSAPRAPD